MPRLHQFPNWTSNPYTNMLNQGVLAEGWQVDGSLTRAEVLAELELLRRGDVFHIQWTQPIAHDAPDRRYAREGLIEFQRALRAAHGRGVAVIWTIHNLIPHSAKYPDIEIELCEFLAAEADRIIQLTSYTEQAASELYTLPSHKLVTIRHASYIGVYGTAPDKLEAKSELGIPESSATVGFIGQIRHYKGVSTLLRAVEILSHRIEDLTLVLGGKTSPAEMDALDQAIPRSVRAVRKHGFLPDEDLPTWFAACDVMAFPYRNILNSGSVILAATCGVPAVLPAEPNLVSEYGAESWVGLFSTDGDVAENLADKVEEMLRAGAEARDLARRFAEGYTALDMAMDYRSVVEDAVRSHVKAVVR